MWWDRQVSRWSNRGSIIVASISNCVIQPINDTMYRMPGHPEVQYWPQTNVHALSNISSGCCISERWNCFPKKRKLPALRHLLNGLGHAQVGIDRLRRQLKVALLPLDLLPPSPSWTLSSRLYPSQMIEVKSVFTSSSVASFAIYSR